MSTGMWIYFACLLCMLSGTFGTIGNLHFIAVMLPKFFENLTSERKIKHQKHKINGIKPPKRMTTIRR